jgi:hypothetical protein
MTATAIRERTVEQYLVTACRPVGLLCLKFVSPGHDGVPDRIIIGPLGIVFVEVKRPGGRLRPLQRAVIAKMRDHGADVRVIDSLIGVDELVAELSGAPSLSI